MAGLMVVWSLDEVYSTVYQGLLHSVLDLAHQPIPRSDRHGPLRSVSDTRHTLSFIPLAIRLHNMKFTSFIWD